MTDEVEGKGGYLFICPDRDFSKYFVLHLVNVKMLKCSVFMFFKYVGKPLEFKQRRTDKQTDRQ